MMTDEMTCRICGGDLASNRHPALKMHQSLSTCIKILRARAEAAEAELEQLAWRPMSETPKRIGTYVVAMMNAGGDGFYYDSICWLPWEKYKNAAQSDESHRAFTGDCEWFYFEEEWPPIHASHMDYLCWMEPDETGVEEMIWRMEEQGEGHDDEMTDELYTQTEKSVRYWTREELLIHAETAENELATLRANTLLQLGINPDAVADDEALEAPPGDMARRRMR